MRGEQGPLLGGEVFDRVAHRRIVVGPPAGRRSGPWRRRSGHQLDPVAAGSDRQGSRLSPVFAFRLDGETGIPQAGDGGLEGGGDDGKVPAGGDGRLLLGHQMDLRALALEPGVLGEGRRRLDPFESDQLEEAGSRLDVNRRDLDSNVVEHTKNLQRRHPYVTFCLLASQAWRQQSQRGRWG